jgi:hypothetical protein
MLIDLVLEADEARRIGRRRAFQYDGAAICHDQPRLHPEQAVLSEGDLALIGADELCALRVTR